MALGISFIPGQGNPNQQQQPSPGESPLQQAIQMLSLRIPRFGGTGTLGGQPPLQERPPGSGLPPQPGTPEWDELMRRLREGIGAGPRPPMQPGQEPPPLGGGGPIVKYPAPETPQPPGPPPTPLPTWPGPGQPRGPIYRGGRGYEPPDQKSY